MLLNLSPPLTEFICVFTVIR